MEYMHKLYYNLKTSIDREELSNIRKNYETTIKTELLIKPMDQSKSFELYFVPNTKTTRLIEDIYVNDHRITLLENSLPIIAQNHFLIDILSDELQNSNEVEGVWSTKEEIASTTKSVLNNVRTANKKRFFSVINSYLYLFNGKLKTPKDLNDIRKIYDKVTEDEIKSDELPDGELFRKDKAYIFSKSVGGEIHRGVSGQEQIHSFLNSIIEFMINNGDLSQIIKIAIAHYYFGYIHPFYDGNGRTGRFISSLFLQEILSPFSALSLSRGCNLERNKYYTAFDSTNKIMSQGEVNYFVDSFLEVLITGQNQVLMMLSEKIELLTSALEKIERDSNLFNDEEEEVIMKVLAQEHLFNVLNKGISADELIEHGAINKSKATIHKRFKTLEEKGLIIKTKSRPIEYVLNPEYLEK